MSPNKKSNMYIYISYIQIQSKSQTNYWAFITLVTHPFPMKPHQTPPTGSHDHRPHFTWAKKGHRTIIWLDPCALTCGKNGWLEASQKKNLLMPIVPFLVRFFHKRYETSSSWFKERKTCVFLVGFCWFKIHQFLVTDLFFLLGHCVQTEIQSKFIQHVFIFGGRRARTYLQIRLWGDAFHV